MKSVLVLTAVIAALALAAPAGAMPLYDHPGSTQTHVAPPPPPADTHDGTSLLVVVLVGAAAFLTGAGAARFVRLPTHPAAG